MWDGGGHAISDPSPSPSLCLSYRKSLPIHLNTQLHCLLMTLLICTPCEMICRFRFHHYPESWCSSSGLQLPACLRARPSWGTRTTPTTVLEAADPENGGAHAGHLSRRIGGEKQHCACTPSSWDEDLTSPGSRDSADPWQNTRLTTVKNRRGRTGPTWKPLAYRDLKGLSKAAKNYGRNSSFFNNLMQATFSVYPLTPRDLKHVVTVLLSQLEYTLWERGSKRLLI